MASPFDLVALSEVKTWLEIDGTQGDALLALLISQVSRAVLTYMDRPSILPTTYTDMIDGGNDTSILLRYWPVQSIATCLIDGREIFSAESGSQAGYVLDPPDATPPGRMQRLHLRGSLFRRGLQNISVSYFAGYQISNEIVNIPISAPYTVSVQAPYGAFASDSGVIDVKAQALNAVSGVPMSGQYSVSSGTYTFAAADGGSSANISYGYVPFDIALAAKEWIAERYAYHSRIGQASKSLGGQETVSFIVKDIPDFIARILQPYCRVLTP
jgi:hypothetical protein